MASTCKLPARWLTLIFLGAAFPASWGQNSATPLPQDLEPGVNTSVTPDEAPDAAARKAAAIDAAGKTRSDAPAKPRVPVMTSLEHAGTTPAASAPVRKGTSARTPDAAAPPSAAAGKAHDRLELDTTQITGNRELPKVLYIVPWKRSDLGDLVGKPVNSLLDEVLAPVDRDVFKRENRYYDALKSGAPPANGAAPQGSDARP